MPAGDNKIGKEKCMCRVKAHALFGCWKNEWLWERADASIGPYNALRQNRLAKLQHTQPRQQGLEADQEQHDAADAFGRSAVLIAEEGTYAHTDGR